MTRNRLGVALLSVTIMLWAVASGAQETSRASCDTEHSCVSFWQRDVWLAGQGWCIVEFGFDGSNLASPVEDLIFTVHVVDKHGRDRGRGTIRLDNPLGGPRASSYATARFEGQDIFGWNEIVGDAGDSPLCWEGTTLVFESAIGTQSSRRVDLVPHGQLRYTTRRLLNVRVK